MRTTWERWVNGECQRLTLTVHTYGSEIFVSLAMLNAGWNKV